MRLVLSMFLLLPALLSAKVFFREPTVNITPSVILYSDTVEVGLRLGYQVGMNSIFKYYFSINSTSFLGNFQIEPALFINFIPFSLYNLHFGIIPGYSFNFNKVFSVGVYIPISGGLSLYTSELGSLKEMTLRVGAAVRVEFFNFGAEGGYTFLIGENINLSGVYVSALARI
ncbi:MAG: hypothetical protein HPY53_11090 [Brevinematales bacterium]|nr:hypothetical protein [Brevinematales bacterium]